MIFANRRDEKNRAGLATHLDVSKPRTCIRSENNVNNIMEVLELGMHTHISSLLGNISAQPRTVHNLTVKVHSARVAGRR